MNDGDRERRAAVLVASDDLVVRLGRLLIGRTISEGGERLTEVASGQRTRVQLAPYGVRYGEYPGHYSGDLEYDRSLLKRAWNEFPETRWGQRAFLTLQQQTCAVPLPGCRGVNCYETVIRLGEKFLAAYPETPFRTEQLLNLARANETWWSLSKGDRADPSLEGVKIDKAAAERARVRAIDIYEELLRIAPEGKEAEAARRALPRLRLRLGTAERAYFCYSC
jgi:hypothetical protein